MAKLPVIKRLSREDYRDAPAWIEKLFTSLNQFMDGVYAALNKSLSIPENVAGEIKEFTITTLAGYDGTPDAPGSTTFAKWEPIYFQHTLKKRPVGLLLLQIQRISALGVPTTPVGTYYPIEGDVYVDWDEANVEVTIGLVRGLAASTKYLMRVLLI